MLSGNKINNIKKLEKAFKSMKKLTYLKFWAM